MECMAAFIQLLLVLLLFISQLSHATNLPSLQGDVLLTRLESPYDAPGDVFIPYGSKVTIESGTILRFARGAQLTVQGTLLARGTADRRILFTSATSALYHDQQQIHRSTGADIRFRLVDGLNVQQGLLQMFFKNRWRYVCTEFYRWFDYDATLTCRMMGFRNGSVIPYRINASETPWYGLVIDQPACRPPLDEHLLDCPGVRSPPQMGINICDGKEFLRLQCDGFFDPLTVLNWAGIIFDRRVPDKDLTDIPHLSDSASPLLPDVNQQPSILQFVDIHHAGLRRESALRSYAERSAAVTVFDQLINPIFENITVLYSAADGMNFSNVGSSVRVRNSLVAHNRGHGIVVTSRYGNVTLDQVHIHDNGGDGLHYTMNNTDWSLREQEEMPTRLYKSFCETANTVEFPSYFTYRPTAAGTCCTQDFSTTYNRRITVHFQSVITNHPRTRYRVEFYNGKFDIMPLLANITFNRSLESFSSYSNDLLVRLCHSCDDPRDRSCWNNSDQVQLYVVYDDGRDADVHLWNSRIVNNSLNGIRLVNLRSLIEINQTLINHNQRHGLDVDSGAGALWTYHSKFNSNGEDGIHLNYDGGERRLFYSDISFNQQHGLSIRMDSLPNGFFLSSLFFPTYAYRQITFINGSSIRSNGFYGLWQRATCHPSLFAINGSLFERSTFDAIRFDSCQHEWRPDKVITYQFRSPVMPINPFAPSISSPSIIYQAPWNVYPQYPSWIPIALLYANETGNTIFNVTWNRFLNNKRVGLRLQPVQNILGDIMNNSFIGHENGALLIVGNQSNWMPDIYLRNVTLRILFNNFTNNQGKNFIVSLDLNELSPYQTILFMYNRLMNNNITSSIVSSFNPRSRMPGVLTIGSSHIRIIRNIFGNNHSQYEIVSQLVNSTAVIQADMNFFTAIYPPPVTLTRNPPSPYERNQYLQNAIHRYRQDQPIPQYSSHSRVRLRRQRDQRDQRDQREQHMQVQSVPQISYTYLSEPYDLRNDFFPMDSVFQQPYSPPQTVQYYPPTNQHEILSVPTMNKSTLLSSINNDWPYYASFASPTPFYYSLYYDRPELCFSQWPLIRNRIFDQHNRSTLAPIIWYPFLCSDRNITTEIWRCQLPNCGFETSSFRLDPVSSTIGGIIDMDYSLSPGRYTVTNDIVVRPDKRLTIQSSELEFINGVGLFVYGELIIQGVDGSPSRLDLFRNQSSTSILVNQQQQRKDRSVMLIDGPSIYEGRLYVTSATQGTGTVCNHGWTRENSILVCLSLGMIHDPNEHLFPMLNPNQTRINDPILWSEVDCDLYQDETLEQCRKETVHTCDHTTDVWIKCLPSSWAGVHIYPSYSKIHLEHVHIESAGQYDIHRDQIHPGLQIDHFAHPSSRLTNLTFLQNVIGLEMKHIHPARQHQAILHHSNFVEQFYAGLVLRSSFLNISHCTFRENRHVGMKFDSTYRADDLEQYRLHLYRSVQTIDLLHQQFFELERHKFVYLTSMFSGFHAEDNLLLNTINIRTDPSFILIVDLIDYNPLSNLNEQLILCEVECHPRLGISTSLSYKKWSLANDRDLFPLFTSYSSLQIHYRLFRYRTSRLTFVVYSVPAPTTIYALRSSFTDIVIRFHRCLFSANEHDIIYSINDREKTNNPYALSRQVKTDLERLIEQVFLGVKKSDDDDPSFDLIENEQKRIEKEFEDEFRFDQRFRRASTMIDIRRRYKNATLQINECFFELNRNRSLLIDHQSIQLTANRLEETIRMLTNDSIQANKPYLPLQLTCRIDQSLFTKNQHVINLDAHPLLFSDRLIRFEVTRSNFTLNHQLLFNLTFPRLYPFNRTLFGSLSLWPHLPVRSIYTRSPWIYSLSSHALRIFQSRFIHNEQGAIRLLGFHSSFNLTHSIFEQNRNDRRSLIDLRHIEKDFLLDGNLFLRNEVRHLISIDTHGHAPFHRDLLFPSTIQFNQFIDNKPRIPSLFSSTINLRGSQNVTIQRNLFENLHYDYELISALITDSANTTIDATLNWWNSDVGQAIQNRIRDFTKLSDHAFVQWNPFLACRESTCPQVKLSSQTILQMNRPLRGLITSHTLIHKRREPYLINGDLIVMPGARLSIEPGVELHFAPNTGLLILGHLNATGTAKDPIVMRLAMKQFVMDQITNGHNPYQYHFSDEVPFSKYKFDPLIDRLQIRLDVGRTPNEGFLQIYNWTRRDWSYVCAETFRHWVSHRLICHQLGLPWKNVLVHPDSFYLFDHQKLPLWQETIDCAGNEPSISSCSFNTENNRFCSKLFYISCYEDNLLYSLNANMQPEFAPNLGGHSQPTASPTYETPQSWNGIRFANSEYEEDLSSFDYTIHDQSSLRYVLISETGDFHPAIQTIYRTPGIERIHIEHSRQIAFEFLLPKQSMLFGYSRITNALNLAMNGLVYYGQSTEDKSTFDLLSEQTIHGQPFGFLDLCNAHRIVSVKYRLITFYKYQNEFRTCSKLFCSNNPYKIGIRFFQVNLINTTYQNDWIEIHRVDHNEQTNDLLIHLTNGSTDAMWKKFYSVEKGCLRVTIHSSSGAPTNGFMGEITVFPITPISTRDVVHQISDNIFLGNQRGVLNYLSAGERSANLYFQSNSLVYNGFYRYNSSSSSINSFLFQNSPRFYFGNNFLSRNLGGTSIQCFSQSLSSIFNGFLFNNVFYRNKNDSILTVTGMEMAAFCNLYASQNAMMYNDAYDRNLIQFDSVVANFSRNQVFNNTGVNIVSMLGFEKITAPFPAVEMNSFRNNRAMGQRYEQLFDRTGAVVEVGNPRQLYMYNTFENWDSRFEMRTRRRLFEPNRMESRSVNASSNYWGRLGDSNDIGARIYDKFDNQTLMEVNYNPPYLDSTRLRQGKCDPGWILDDNLCYIYFGATTTYPIAQEFCSSIDARITRRDTPLNRLVILRALVRSSQYQGINSDAVPSSGIWLRKEQHQHDCRIFTDLESMDISCSATAAFICEKEQQFDGMKLVIRGDLLIAIGCFLLMIILIVLVLCCWCCKSRQRRKDNFHRQNSLRRSVKQEMNKQSSLSLHKSHEHILNQSSTLSTLTNTTANKLPLSTLSLSSRPLSSVTLTTDHDLSSTPSPEHHDFSILKLNHHIPKASTPALSEDTNSQRGLVLPQHTDQSSVYSSATTDSATLYRSRRRFVPIPTPAAPPIIHRRSLRHHPGSVSTGSVSPPPAYVSPAHQTRRHRSDQLQLIPGPHTTKKTFAIGIQADSSSQISSRSTDTGPPPPLETDI